MEEVNDEVFGNMKYYLGWRKEEKIAFYTKELTIEVVAEAYKNDTINDIQRAAYKEYQETISDKFEQLPQILLDYYIYIYDDYIKDYINVPEKINKENITKEKIVKLVKPRTLYFDKKGKYGYICDCAWENEHGIAIVLSGDKPKIGEVEELI